MGSKHNGFARMVMLGAVLAGCGDAEDSGPAPNMVEDMTMDSPSAPAQNSTGSGTGAIFGDDPDASINLGDLVPQCDPEIESVSACGGQECPALVDAIAAPLCIVNCCVDQVCGTRTAALTVLSTTECVPTVLPDDRCPDLSIGGGALNVSGCCVESSNECGLLVLNNCVPRAQASSALSLLPLPPAPMSMADGGVPAAMTDGGTGPANFLGLDLSPANCDGTPVTVEPPATTPPENDSPDAGAPVSDGGV